MSQSSPLTRRQLIGSVGAALASTAIASRATSAQPPAPPPTDLGPLSAAVLPAGIRSRFINNVNGQTKFFTHEMKEVSKRSFLLWIHTCCRFIEE